MKKILILLLCLLLTASITGCGTQSIKPIDTIEGNMKTYSEMSDGTWQCDGHIYKYRLEISGRLSNAVKDSTYIYLSNIEDITFEQAWKASGLSSNMDDYFDIDEAVLVELPDWQLSVIRSVDVLIFLRYTPSKRSVLLWVEKFMTSSMTWQKY